METQWLEAVRNSHITEAHKQVMSMLSVQEMHNGNVICIMNREDAPLVTSRLKEKIEGLIGPSRKVFYSIRTKDTEMPEYELESQSAAKFRKQLGWLIKESPDAMRMEITPEMANVMLERNQSDEWRNRPQSAAALKRYIKAMREGRWVYTGQPIIFSSSGNLVNGQHTLVSASESGATIEALVAFDVDDEAFMFMDCGASRSPGDIFAIEGIKNYNFAAAVASVVWAYRNPNWSGSTGSGSSPERDQLLDFYWQNEGIQDSFTLARKFRQAGLLSAKWAGAMHYICASKNRAMADDFFERVATGIGINHAKAPENTARNAMLKSATASSDSAESSTVLSAKLIICWNAFRRGENLAIARWRTSAYPDKKFPRAI